MRDLPKGGKPKEKAHLTNSKSSSAAPVSKLQRRDYCDDAVSNIYYFIDRIRPLLVRLRNQNLAVQRTYERLEALIERRESDRRMLIPRVVHRIPLMPHNVVLI